MQLTAQRVISPVSKQHGINVYFYIHGDYTWHGPADHLPKAMFCDSIITVHPPGNRVRSYIDIISPDTSSRQEVARAFEIFVGAVPRLGLPARCYDNATTFEFNAEQSLAQVWGIELRQLFGHCMELLRQNGR